MKLPVQIEKHGLRDGFNALDHDNLQALTPFIYTSNAAAN
jgi:hypothetical protein